MSRPRFAAAFTVLFALAAVAPQCARAAAPDLGTVERVLLPHIRERFHAAIDDAEVAREVMAYVERHFSPDTSQYPPAVLAYYAALEGLRGKHDANPLRKFRFVSGAIQRMNSLVDAHPELLEVRFLRFSFFEQIPAVFGVHHHVPQDLRAILELLESGRGREVPPSARADMIAYILGTDEPSAAQRRQLELLKEIESSIAPAPRVPFPYSKFQWYNEGAFPIHTRGGTHT